MSIIEKKFLRGALIEEDIDFDEWPLEEVQSRLEEIVKESGLPWTNIRLEIDFGYSDKYVNLVGDRMETDEEAERRFMREASQQLVDDLKKEQRLQAALREFPQLTLREDV